MSKRILVTGITGFIGQNLIPSLIKEGFVIYGHSRKPEQVQQKYPDVLPAPDKLTEAWLADQKIEAIIHLAGIAHDLSGKYVDDDYFSINRDATIRLFRKFQQVQPQGAFIFLSSIKALTDHNEAWLTEDMKPDPKTAYGKSKQEAEALLLMSAHEASVYALRPCMVYGPGNKGNLNLLYQFVKRGLPWPLAAFHNERTFVSVDHLSMVIIRMLEDTVAPGIYHVADDEAVSTNQLVMWIGEALHKKVRMLKVSSALIRKMVKIAEWLHLPFQEKQLDKLVENYKVSNQKLREAIPALPAFPTKDKLIKTIQSFHG